MICVEACMGAEQAGQRASLGVPCHLLKHSHVGRVILTERTSAYSVCTPTRTQLIDLAAELHVASGWHYRRHVAGTTWAWMMSCPQLSARGEQIVP